MESHDRETISRVLEAALASLKEGADDERAAGPTAVTSIGLPSSDARPSGAPVVILIHPNPKDRDGIPKASGTETQEPNSCACSHSESPLHPGLERFPLSESDSRDPSKMCFIEPDRVCVGSGACETLGY